MLNILEISPNVEMTSGEGKGGQLTGLLLLGCPTELSEEPNIISWNAGSISDGIASPPAGRAGLSLAMTRI